MPNPVRARRPSCCRSVAAERSPIRSWLRKGRSNNNAVRPKWRAVQDMPVGKGDAMGRWIAIGKVPGWDDLGKFTDELKATAKWRLDPRTTITSVTALADGRLIAECHANSQADFDAWLKQ